MDKRVFQPSKKKLSKKQAKKLRFLSLLIGLWTKYCSAGAWGLMTKYPENNLCLCPFLI